MRRRDISKALFATAAGSTVVTQRVEAQTCTAPCYAQTAAEISAGVTPVNYAYAPPDVRRYGAVFGGTDSTTAFTNAKAANGGVAYVPYGTSSFTTTSAITNIGLFGPGTVVAGGITLNPNSIEKGVSTGRSGGNGCTAWGVNALASNGAGGLTPGNNNTAFGNGALASLSGGASNPSGSTAVGQACLALSNGATNTAVGANAMGNDLTGTDNTAVGAYALFSETTATANNCFGFNAGYSITTGDGNSCYGNYAGWTITTGIANICIGGSAGYNLGTGHSNLAIGVGALENNINGHGNIAIGYFAGNHANSANEIYIDNQDRGSNVNELANAPIYGSIGAAAASNIIRINAQFYCTVGNLGSYYAAPTIVSATTIAPVAMITFVSGTAAISTITVPSWMGGGAKITLIPTGVFTWETGGNIALAGTAVVSRALDFTYDSGTGKWYPSYVS